MHSWQFWSKSLAASQGHPQVTLYLKTIQQRYHIFHSKTNVLFILKIYTLALSVLKRCHLLYLPFFVSWYQTICIIRSFSLIIYQGGRKEVPDCMSTERWGVILAGVIPGRLLLHAPTHVKTSQLIFSYPVLWSVLFSKIKMCVCFF